MNTLVTYEHEVLSASDFERIVAARRVADAAAHEAAERRGQEYAERLYRNVRQGSGLDAVDTAIELTGWFVVGFVGAAILDTIF